MPEAALPPLARPVPAGAVPDLVGRVRLLLLLVAAPPAAAAAPARVARERAVDDVGAAVAALGLVARVTARLLLLLLPELPPIREGDSSEVAAA